MKFKQLFLTLPLVASLLFTTTSTSAFNPDLHDPYEPNDFTYTAYVVPHNMPFYPETKIHAYISAPHDFDFFKFTAITNTEQRTYFDPPDKQAYVISVFKGNSERSLQSFIVRNDEPVTMRYLVDAGESYTILINAHRDNVGNNTDPYYLIP
ncbi:hypothetical protein I6N90_04675 [Paenibacillus sp. GSMTC-2017]|uniref:hypothetical protein n=1 Tax=Paenibacillus sp. GSMTC-2017 TaxID=2794350 RepID=UPI0018D7FAEE|nr:hypothetical protein [Paenibacillus sp. GSMTC-2017]MBH5317102.1 hypothetical protein [Paenibacillus sp. GSMTC-2017]